MVALGGSGPGAMYNELSVTYDTNHSLDLKNGRKQLLSMIETYVEIINNNEEFLKIFTVPKVERSNVSLGLITGLDCPRESWDITIIQNVSNVILYHSPAVINGTKLYFLYGEETLEEADRVSKGDGPFERVITHTRYGRRNIVVQLHGEWGYFIERAVIKQMEEGDFIYYAMIDGEKCKLRADGERVVVESTGEPIIEIFPPLPEI